MKIALQAENQKSSLSTKSDSVVLSHMTHLATPVRCQHSTKRLMMILR